MIGTSYSENLGREFSLKNLGATYSSILRKSFCNSQMKNIHEMIIVAFCVYIMVTRYIWKTLPRVILYSMS